MAAVSWCDNVADAAIGCSRRYRVRTFVGSAGGGPSGWKDAKATKEAASDMVGDGREEEARLRVAVRARKRGNTKREES